MAGLKLLTGKKRKRQQQLERARGEYRKSNERDYENFKKKQKLPGAGSIAEDISGEMAAWKQGKKKGKRKVPARTLPIRDKRYDKAMERKKKKPAGGLR